jgi:hypothetical protein
MSILYVQGKQSVSDSDSNVSVLNRGTEPVIRLRFSFVLKLDLVSPSSEHAVIRAWRPEIL